MLENLALIDLASAMARHATVRHRLLAENVANADTPGFRARDVEDFQSFVNETFPGAAFAAKATRPGHVGAASGPADPPSFELDLPGSPDGNTVNIEDQAVRAVQVQGDHALALSIYAKALDILRLGLGRAR